VLSDYPDYDRLDEVLWRLSECLVFSARKAEALPQLDRLLAEYPQSGYASDARQLVDRLAKENQELNLAPAAPPSQGQPPPRT
jgi:cellulose synthase operon protein C